MEKKDLLAQNSEQENESTAKAKAPSKKRTTRKRTDSQKASDAQKEKELPASCDIVSNENDIQNDENDASPSQIESVVAEIDNEDLPISENEENGEFDYIPTPDEIFATFQIESEPIEVENAEETETFEAEENEDGGPEATEAEENEVEEPDVTEAEEIEEDIQYSFTNIETTKTESAKTSRNDTSQRKYNPLKPRRIDKFFDFIELVAFTLLAVMILTSFVFRHSIVDGESMENTLHSSEHLIISDLFYTPDRGDIIVCEDYTTSIPKPIVKRVIAIEGDTVKITSDGKVYVNGALVDESRYVYIDDLGYEYKELELTVPKNEIFVMGDHRNKSTDSREIGTVSEDSVLGKVLLRFYPFNKFGKVD